MRRFLAPSLLVAAAPGLAGCAAVAVPVAAGLLLGERPNDASRAQRVASSDPGRESAASPAAIPSPAPGPRRMAHAESKETAAVLTGLSELPAPSGQSASKPSGTAYAEMADTALAVARQDPFGERKRFSAMLVDPASLSPQRVECSYAQTAVLIDLDPADGEAPLGDDLAGSPELARILAALRGEEIAVLWLSAHTADRAGAVRRALRSSGLDPQGQDELYLVRYRDDTKPSRRADAAGDYCIVAILGDEKADFDELFGFLKEPEAPFGLESIIGEAWFLGPPPLSSDIPSSEQG